MGAGKRSKSKVDGVGVPGGGRLRGPWLALLIIPAGILAYANSFAGVFILDDIQHIVTNQDIRRLWPIWQHLQSARPVVEVSLAVNYALGELEVWGYHAFNLAVHLLAGLTLFGVVRRTLLREPLRASYAGKAPWLAVVVSLIWLLHPLQTQSVTYLIQRAESLMGLFYLLTLYCVVCGVDSSRRRRWYACAVAACALGMASKAVMVTAPLVVLLYDRIFLSRSFRQALGQRWGLYVGLAGSWLVLVACGVVQGVVSAEPAGPAAVGFGLKGITPMQYALTQPGVILHYLKLCFWPRSLCFDYQWPVARGAMGIGVPTAAVVVLVLATGWGLWRRPRLGFLGAWFFLILGPTSSFVPIKDVAFEQRMYLPLAAVVVLAVFVGERLVGYGLQRRPAKAVAMRGAAFGVVMVVLALLGYATADRNRDYRSAVAMWSDVAVKRPDNARARNNLGIALRRSGRIDEAIRVYQEAIRLDPDSPAAYANLGKAFTYQGKYEQAIEPFRKSLQINPNQPYVRTSFGIALRKLGRLDEAVEALQEALRLQPDFTTARLNLGHALSQQDKLPEAIKEYRRVLEIEPGDEEAHYGLANALSEQGETEQAIRHYRQALRINPRHTGAGCNLGNVYFGQGQLEEATEMYRRVLRIDPGHVNAQYNLGLALAKQGRLAEAAEAYRRVLEIAPEHVGARQSLAGVLAQQEGGKQEPQRP